MFTQRIAAPKIETDLVKYEIDPIYSREAGTLLAGQSTKIGTLLGQIATVAAMTASAAAEAGNVGDGALTLANPAVTTAVQEGVYVVSCIEPASNGGVFVVEDPAGVVIGIAKVGTAFSKQVKFTIADGATDFAAGDRFRITVSAASGAFVYKPWTPAATDGSEIVAAVSLTEADAEASDILDGLVVLRRGALIAANGIAWPEGVTAGQKAAAIAALDRRTIFTRPSY